LRYRVRRRHSLGEPVRGIAKTAALSGNNSFTLESGGGEIIKSVSILALDGGLFQDVRQERLGGISGAVPVASLGR
jgi:hypothetical protein